VQEKSTAYDRIENAHPAPERFTFTYERMMVGVILVRIVIGQIREL